MALKTTVKVTVNNLSDARYCAGMGVDLIGFSAEREDPFYLSPDNFNEISEWLSGVDFVAEVNREKTDLDKYAVSYVEVNTPAKAPLFPNKNIILNGSVEEMRSWKTQLGQIPNLAFLLLNIDADKAGLDSLIEEFAEFTLLIGFDLSADEVEKIAASKASGIALKGSDEIKPGLKDYDELADILESLEVDAPY